METIHCTLNINAKYIIIHIFVFFSQEKKKENVLTVQLIEIFIILFT